MMQRKCLLLALVLVLESATHCTAFSLRSAQLLSTSHALSRSSPRIVRFSSTSGTAISQEQTVVENDLVQLVADTSSDEQSNNDTKQKQSILFSQLLAFNSGALNGIFLSGLLGKVQAVGPVTDSYTKLSLALSGGTSPWPIAAVVASFASGSLLMGLLNPNPQTYDLSKRRQLLLVASTFLGTAAFLIHRASTSAANSIPRAAFLLVSAANGMQNSFTSTLTQNWCRSTHVTGTTTDLFTVIGQCLRGNRAQLFKIPIYSGIIVMFALGGFMGTQWTQTWTHAAACLSLSTSLYLVSALPWPLRRPTFMGRS